MSRCSDGASPGARLPAGSAIQSPSTTTQRSWNASEETMSEEMFRKAYNTALSMLSAGQLTTLQDAQLAVTAVAQLLAPHYPGDTLDTERLIRDLEAALRIFQEDSSALVDDTGHLAWLSRRR